MSILHELLVSALLILGASFALVGSYGMIRLPELMTRLHAPTKATTLGVGSALLASMLHFLLAEGTLSIHELLISLFLFLTAPVTALFIAKAHLHTEQQERAKLPRPERHDWATFESPLEGQAAQDRD
jgi:multicomponent K+:H+ antiporter subunit G